MPYFAGIDLGSTTTEFIILDQEKNVRAFARTLTSGNIAKASEEARSLALAESGLAPEDLAFIVATGYGRKNVAFAQKAVTEITCYARGANHLNPEIRSVLDIGGQDSKFIAVDGSGRVENFAMNDKCAAGTGRFLEMLARTFDVPLDAIGDMSLAGAGDSRISSICAVFAESEMISLFSRGVPREDIARAAHRAVSERVGAMAHRVGIREPVMFCGGVAKNRGMAAALTEVLKTELFLPEDPEGVGALGAALSALEAGKD